MFVARTVRRTAARARLNGCTSIIYGATPMSPLNLNLRLPSWIVFTVLYLSWGSTFLATRFANESIPPLLMAGTRFFVAGVLLFAWLRRSGVEFPNPASWGRSAVTGLLLLTLGNGSLSWSLVTLPSGVAALFVGTIPVWMVILERLEPHAAPLRKQVSAGLVLGLCGLFMVTRTAGIGGIGDAFDESASISVAVLLFGCMAWAVGSLQARRRPATAPLLMSVAMQMLSGGAALVALATISGEWHILSIQTVSLRSAVSVGYLIVVGTLIGYSSYAWLLRVSTLSRVGTFAYVNPVIALILGWTVGGETMGAGSLAGAATILGGVLLMKVDLGPILDRLLVRTPVAPRRTLTAVRSRGSRTGTLTQ